MDICGRQLGRQVDERPISRSELYGADEVFLTGTGCEIVPVIEIDRRAIGSRSKGVVTSAVQAAYESIVRAEDARYAHWLTRVDFAEDGAGA
jgi:branched-chain amino acid aminotransferase